MASSNLFDLLALLFIHFLWLGLVRFSLLLCCFEQFIYYWFLKYKQLFVIIISQFIYYLFLKYKQVFVAFVVLHNLLIIMTYYCYDDWLLLWWLIMLATEKINGPLWQYWLHHQSAKSHLSQAQPGQSRFCDWVGW